MPYGCPPAPSGPVNYIYPLDLPDAPDQTAEDVLTSALWEKSYFGENITSHHAAILAGAAVDALHRAGYMIVATR